MGTNYDGQGTSFTEDGLLKKKSEDLDSDKRPQNRMAQNFSSTQ